MTTLARIRGLNRRTKLLLLANAVNSFGGGLVVPFLWIYLGQVRGLALWVPAATLAVQAATAVVAGLGWGAVLDRLPYRAVVPTVMTVAGVGTGLYAFAAGPVTALVAAVVYGVGIAGVGTVLRSLYAGVTSKEQRGLAYSLDFGIFNAMTGVGVLVGGAVAAGSLDAGRYAVLYLLDGATFLLTAVAAVVVLKPVPASPIAEAPGDPAAVTEAPAGYRALLRDPAVGAVLAIMLCCSVLSYGQLRSGLPGYLTMHGAVSARGFSIAFAVDIVAAVLAQAALLPRVGRVSRTRQVAASGGLWAVAWLLILAAGRSTGTTALVLAMAGVGLISVGATLVVPGLTALLNDVAPERLRGRANAAFSTTLSGGAIVGPVLAAGLLPLGSGVPLVAVLAVLSLGVTVLTLRLRHRIPASADVEAPAPAGAAELAAAA